jgi:hypothetical protein
LKLKTKVQLSVENGFEADETTIKLLLVRERILIRLCALSVVSILIVGPLSPLGFHTKLTFDFISPKFSIIIHSENQDLAFSELSRGGSFRWRPCRLDWSLMQNIVFCRFISAADASNGNSKMVVRMNLIGAV